MDHVGLDYRTPYAVAIPYFPPLNIAIAAVSQVLVLELVWVWVLPEASTIVRQRIR